MGFDLELERNCGVRPKGREEESRIAANTNSYQIIFV